MPTAIFLGLGIGLGIWVCPSIATGKDQMWRAQAAGTCAAPGDTKVHITVLFRLLKWIQNPRPCVRLSPSCTSRSWERSDVLNSVLPNVPHVFYCYSAVMHGALSTCFLCLLEDWLGVTMALHVGVSLERMILLSYHPGGASHRFYNPSLQFRVFVYNMFKIGSFSHHAYFGPYRMSLSFSNSGNILAIYLLDRFLCFSSSDFPQVFPQFQYLFL